MQELERERLRQEQAQSGDTAESPERTNVKFMISGEAPVLMSKACELLIKDLSFRAWQHTERNRRRTLQRQDLHAAVGESEVYDFLIDIVPRVQTAQVQAPPAAAAAVATMGAPDMSMMQAAIPTTYHQIPQMAATMNTAQMQHTAQAMAAAVPAGGALPTGTQSVVPVPAGVDIAGNPQSGMIAYAPAAIPTQDALNHLAQWDPAHMPFQTPVQAPAQALEGQQYQPPPPQHQQQQQQQHIANPVHPQHLQQQQQPQVKQENTQQQQQQPPPPQMQAQHLQHAGQWMDPTAIAGMAAAPPPPPPAAPAAAAGSANQPAPGV